MDKKICPLCGKQSFDSESNCLICDAPLKADAQPSTVVAPATKTLNETSTPPETPKKNKSKKGLIIALAIVAVLITGAIILAIVLSDSSSDSVSTDDTVTSETEPDIVGEDLLIGNWKTALVMPELNGAELPLHFSFEEDGEYFISLTADDYTYFIENAVYLIMSEYTDEDFAAEGYSREELVTLSDQMLREEMPFSDLYTYFDISGTWSLDGDILTLIDYNNNVFTVETYLSEGETRFTMEIFDDELTLYKN